MSESQSSFRDKLATGIGKFAGSRFVRSIIDSGYAVIPFTIVGAIFLILTVLPQAFPIPGFAGLYAHTLGKFSNMFTVVYNANMGILSLIFGGQFTYSYAKIYQQEEKINIVPLNALFMMLMAMFITVPEMVYKNGSIQFVQSLKADNIIGGGIQVSGSGVTRIGTTGLFTAIVIGWATVQIYRFTVKHNWQIKMPDVVPAGVSNSFSSLIPGFCVAFVVATINLILVLMGTDIFKVMYVPFSFVGNIAGTWWGVLIIVFFIHFLWWFGIHGANIMSSFYTPIALANLAANVKGARNFFAGDPMNAFIILGGSGSTLLIAWWMAGRAKSAQLREIGKVEAVPALFNINEPFLFGLPVVYNVNLFVPFIGAPMASAIVAYIFHAIGFMPDIKVQQPWPTPIGLGGYLATLSWRGAVVAIVCAIVAFVIWYPFMKRFDLKTYKKEQEEAKQNANA